MLRERCQTLHLHLRIFSSTYARVFGLSMMLFCLVTVNGQPGMIVVNKAISPQEQDLEARAASDPGAEHEQSSGDAITDDQFTSNESLVSQPSNTTQTSDILDVVADMEAESRPGPELATEHTGSEEPISEPVAPVYEVVATGYYAGVESTGKSPGHPEYGITYSGIKVRRGVVSTIAADLSLFPLGTVLYIPDYGYGVVADIGGAIKGNIIDLYFPSKEDIYREWGKRRVKVIVVEEGDGRLDEAKMQQLEKVFQERAPLTSPLTSQAINSADDAADHNPF